LAQEAIGIAFCYIFIAKETMKKLKYLL